MAEIGYARVSTGDQDTALQVAALRKAGVVDIREETVSAVKDRPVLDSLLLGLRAGDVLVVYKLDRLARSITHFVHIFDKLRRSGVGFRSLTEALDTTNPQGRMMIQVLAVFAEFERELIRERCIAGQRAARAAGKTWGRLSVFTPAEAQALTEMWRSGWWEQATLAEMCGVSLSCLRDTIHRVEGRGRWSSKTLRK